MSARALRSSMVIVLGLLCMAPTVGDVGGCGREATLLEPARYGAARKAEDCKRCSECGIETPRCSRACDPKFAPEVELPSTCKPLLHDGEVCIRALHALSCDAYAETVSDAPTLPSECQFCKVGPAPPPSGALGDGG